MELKLGEVGALGKFRFPEHTGGNVKGIFLLGRQKHHRLRAVSIVQVPVTTETIKY